MTAPVPSGTRVTRGGRAFFTGAMATALLVGALQMYRVHGGLLTDYGADLFGTAWLYAMVRQGRTVVRRGRILTPEVAAALVFAGCAASEFGQRWHLVPGHFDPMDLLTYALAVVACAFLDRTLLPMAE
ncbi:MAG TPA: hypothetical protein VFI13_08260 [Gemmatimonadales bacterium]|nr:hypothetical protein [Gemmatimonadales bacterium]